MADSDQLRGVAVVKAALRSMPGGPGVYRMIDAEGAALYVGKAKNLARRLAAYLKPERMGRRIARMIYGIAAVEVVTTHTEAEALLLEAGLIKSLKPRYNILLRDDKSFPEIMLTGDHDFPRVVKHRGARKKGAEYFGPYASAWAVNRTLDTLQRAFLLRTCSDAVFSGRTRPCLLYQIKRCCGPCVGKLSEENYRALVDQSRAFLGGHSTGIQKDLAAQMHAASEALDFETAAELRDRLRALSKIQSKNEEIGMAGVAQVDVIAVHQEGGQSCVQIFFFRGGRNHGNRAYFPAHAKSEGPEAVVEAFLGQFYAARKPPGLILLDRHLPNDALIRAALSLRAERSVRFHVPQRGDKKAVLVQARRNAREALLRRLSESATQSRLIDDLAEILALEAPPSRIEVYDNSHLGGQRQVGAMIVAGREGFLKKAYRRFNIKSPIAPGDDYAMMREVLTRRFARALKAGAERDSEQWPDLVIVDGGPGQLNVARAVLEDLGIEDLPLCAVSKGPDRHAGREKIHLPGRQDPLALEADDPVLHFVQRLRDEAHRFAIGAQRKKRSAAISYSILDEVPGIGAKRKKALLHHFGSAKEVAQAGLSDLERVTGISNATARRIYDWFHTDR